MAHDKKLTERDEANIRGFVGRVMDNYKGEGIARDVAIGSVAHVMAALAEGDIGEARRWIEEGSTLGHGN